MRLGRRDPVSWDWALVVYGYGRCIVGFKDIEALEFLVYDCKWLEFLRFDHLLVKPILNFILFDLWQFLMGIVEMSPRSQ